MKLKITLLFLLMANVVLAQNNAGGIDGKVLNEEGAPMDYVSVSVTQGGITKGGQYTDANGNFRIKPLSPGTYTLEVKNIGYATAVIENVVVNTDKMTTQNVQLQKARKDLGVVTIRASKLIDKSNPGNAIKNAEDLKNLPTISTADYASTVAGVYQRNQGSGAVNIGGGRSSNTQYMIDGMLVLGSRGVNFSPGAIQSVQVMKTGMSAKYGNATGGIISINTRGISAKTVGGIQAQTSVDGYFNNLLALDLSGPLVSKKDANGYKTPKLGYVLNVSGTYNKDNNPSYYKYQVLKPEVLSALQANPLIENPNGTGSFIRAAEAVTAADFKTIKAREQGDDYSINYLGKLDYQPTTRMNVTLGTYFNYNHGRGFSMANTLFAPEANSIFNSYSARANLRLTQSLGKSESQKDKDAPPSIFSNAFYSLQLSYQRDYSDGANPDHGGNTFNYGYIGKFTQERTPFYVLDTAMGYRGLKFIGNQSSGLKYTRGGINPLLENYTAQVINSSNFDINNLITLQGLGGLLNGSSPGSAYGLYTGPGAQITSYNNAQEDRVSLNLDASFDLQQGLGNKANTDPIVHQIEFGMGYEQRTSRSYSVAAAGLWTQMRLLANRHLQNRDIENPIYVVGGNSYTLQQLQNSGIQFSEFDTIKYEFLSVADDQSRFAKSIREKLFGDPNSKNIVDVDDLSPSTFSLNMFSATDLFNQGSSFVGYTGYDYLGNIQRKQPSFNDFWTRKDARGDYLRPIAAYNPNYMFGYILDKFSFKDINFNVGMRVDRFDANQNVLRDPYSLYGVRNLGSISGLNYKLPFDAATNSNAPDPIKSGFNSSWVPYVDNNQTSNPTLVGYRDGDIWYDPYGREIADPTQLSEKYANGLPIQPWLTDNTDSIKSENYKVSNAFQDYKPDIAVSPRVQFTFPITDLSLFYGNYDVVTQYPSGNNFVTPDDYYYIQERGGTINNANLRMEKTINYTLGFEQAITERSKIGFEVYYRERKNQIQLQRYLLAYPIGYTSYGNRDFSTTKGFIFRYDMRRTGPVQLSVDYTLQFAEGTGSSSASSASLLASGQPNLRTVFPMPFDSRHIINIVFDYRYDMFHNKGPKIGEHYVLNGLGANLLMRSRSGEPFTRSSLAVPLTGSTTNAPIIGERNGSRLPWNYDFGLRVDKTFVITNIGKKRDAGGEIMKGSGRPLSLNVYSFVQNLLNTRNTLSVYNFTGVADDDGYLNSPLGIQNVNNTIIFQQSYRDLYNNSMLNPFNVNNPRRINVGVTLSF